MHPFVHPLILSKGLCVKVPTKAPPPAFIAKAPAEVGLHTHIEYHHAAMLTCTVLLDLRTIINAWAYYVLQTGIRRSMSIQDSDDSDIDEPELASAMARRVLTWNIFGTSEELIRPCVDCGLYTSNFCESTDGYGCSASDRVPSEHWCMNQATPLCTRCEDHHTACRFCRKVHGCTPHGGANFSYSASRISLFLSTPPQLKCIQQQAIEILNVAVSALDGRLSAVECRNLQ